MAKPGNQRDTKELERGQNAHVQAGGAGQSSGRTQPVSTAPPTDEDEHAKALLAARQRILDAVDQYASQIPYGEEFVQQAKEAVATALDYMEAQALEREAELQRDLGAASEN